MSPFVRIVCCVGLALTLTLSRAAESGETETGGSAELALLPAETILSGPAARQRLLPVLQGNGLVVDAAEEGATFESSRPEVCEIERGELVPRGNGDCDVTVRVGQRRATARVRVQGFDQPWTWSFRNHVQPVLAKAGCNSGACHGAQAGKNGFRLSLRGYDAAGDWRTLTRQSRGRRIVPSDPGRSLLLTKATGAVPHKGGVRFEPNSPAYRVLAEWIAAGTPAPSESDPRLTRLELLPPAAALRPGARLPFLVRAHFSDGRQEDVTRWTKFASTNLPVCEVDESGLARVVGHGEGAITAWCLSQVAVATVSSPFPDAVPAEAFAQAPRRNFIDEHVLRKLAALRLPPSPPASDAEFLRRSALDAAGVLPTAEETRAFLADASPDKRDQWIEKLLARSEFIDYWTYKWSDLLLVNSEKLPPPAMWAYHQWIRRQVAAGVPWDRFVSELLTANGSTLANGATNFFVLHQDPQDLAETTAQAFLGMSIGCAKCHNHPLEKWTNDQYYGLANLFARVRAKDGVGLGNRVIFSVANGDVIQPLTGRPQPPRPLDAEPLPFDGPLDRRAALAAWVVSPENPQFARSIVNRVWANFFDVGLVESVDDLRQTNPASNGPLLDELAAFLVREKFQLPSLMRLILQSHAYQRSGRPVGSNVADARFYSRYYPRRLMAETLLDAVSQATGVPSEFPGYPRGWRAVQLPDSNVQSYFLKTFGRPERVITCECERTGEPSMVQVLHLSNGDVLNQKLAAADGAVGQLLARKLEPPQLVEELYLRALSRFPTEKERTALARALAETPEGERRAAVEDLFWSVLTSKEFLFNH